MGDLYHSKIADDGSITFQTELIPPIVNGIDTRTDGDFFAELIGKDNMFKTSPQEASQEVISEASTLVACIDRAGMQKRLFIFRIYDRNHAQNTKTGFPLEGNAYGLKQFETEFVLVLCDNKISIFNVATLTHEKNIEFQGMFQRAILVESESQSLGDLQIV